MSKLPRASTWSPSGVGYHEGEVVAGQSHSRQLRAEVKPPAIPQTPDAQPTKSTTEPEIFVYNHDIYIYGENSLKTGAVALFDTQCQAGDWISSGLVEKLNKTEEITQLGVSGLEPIVDFHGRRIVPMGSIQLSWKMMDGKKMHDGTFYVVASDHLDVLIGEETIRVKKILPFNMKAVQPMLAHKRENIWEKARKTLLEEQHRQDKATLEAKRLDLGKGKQQRYGQSSRG